MLILLYPTPKLNPTSKLNPIPKLKSTPKLNLIPKLNIFYPRALSLCIEKELAWVSQRQYMVSAAIPVPVCLFFFGLKQAYI